MYHEYILKIYIHWAHIYLQYYIYRTFINITNTIHIRDKKYTNICKHIQQIHNRLIVLLKLKKLIIRILSFKNVLFIILFKGWQRQAYQKQQYLITYNFTYISNSVNRKKDFMFKVKTQYHMADQVKHIFNQKNHPSQIITPLIDRKIGPTQSKFQGQLQVPYGTAINRLFYYQRQSNHDQYTQTQLTQKKIKKDDFIIRQQPLFVPKQQILSLIQSSMKIQQDINKTLQQKQLQTKKRNASSSLCCYTFEQLWSIITANYSQQLSLNQYQPSTIQRIKLTLQKYLNEAYQIFFYYFILENQQKDKKQQLGIIYQDMMHFLKDYGILNDMINLNNFLEFYNSDQTKFKKMQDTMDINQHSIKFPQFVVILLRSIQFVQTSTFLMKGQTYDTATTKIFQKIVQKDTDVNQFTQFRRNLRENPKIISFVRSHSQKLKQIYTWMIKKSTKLSSNSFIVQKQQFKQLLIVSSLAQNNTDKIVNQCFKQLKLDDQIFYYDFLIAIEWLAMAIIEDQKEDQVQNQDQEALMIVEKMKYLLQKIFLD